MRASHLFRIVRNIRSAAAVRPSALVPLTRLSILGIGSSGNNGGGGGSSTHASTASHSILAVVPIVVAAFSALFGTNKAENCGIIGVVGGNDDAKTYLLEGLTIMRNRG